MDLNKVMLIWRVTGTPTTATITGNQSKVANFSLATNRAYKDKDNNLKEDAEFHNCTAYGQLAELIEKYVTKGKKMYVEGRLKTKMYTDKQSIERKQTVIIVDQVIFLDSAPANPNQNLKDQAADHSPENQDDDVPF